MLADYRGGSLVNLIASLAGGLGGRVRHAPLGTLSTGEVRSARNVVLFVIDGLGDKQLRQHLPEGTLSAARRTAITSVFPPTTASAITTLFTGCTPLEHGVTGWHTYFPEAACVAAALPMRSRGDDIPLAARGLRPSEAFPENSFFDELAVGTTVVSDRRIIDSGYNRHHCGRALRVPYERLEQLADHTVAAVKASAARKLVYAYWPEFDAASHRYGPGGPEALACARAVDAAFGSMSERLAGTNTMLIATADHGFLETPVENTFSLEDAPGLAALLRLPLCGERRAVFCHVQAGRAPEFIDRARDWLGERAHVMPSVRLLEDGWFGPGRPHAHLMTRLGDVAFILRGTYTVKDWVRGEPRHALRGNHGGISEDEMLIPLVVKTV